MIPPEGKNRLLQDTITQPQIYNGEKRGNNDHRETTTIRGGLRRIRNRLQMHQSKNPDVNDKQKVEN